MTAVEMMGVEISIIVTKKAQQKVTKGLRYYYEPANSCAALANVIM